MDNRSLIGSRIRSIRESQKLSREKLAEQANISTQFLADIETGKKGMTVATLQKLCSALHVTSDSIINGVSDNDFSDILPVLSSVPKEKQNEVKEILQKIIKLI